MKKKYRKKPVIVEAEQFWPMQKPWPHGVVMHKWDTGPGDVARELPTLHTHDGPQLVAPGDYIVTGDGPTRVYRPAVFELHYELAD